MDFAMPADLQAYLDELDAFIEAEIRPLELADDNIRFFDHRREWARTDFENGGLPREEWEDLLREARRRADAAGSQRPDGHDPPVRPAEAQHPSRLQARVVPRLGAHRLHRMAFVALAPLGPPARPARQPGRSHRLERHAAPAIGGLALDRPVQARQHPHRPAHSRTTR